MSEFEKSLAKRSAELRREISNKMFEARPIDLISQLQNTRKLLAEEKKLEAGRYQKLLTEKQARERQAALRVPLNYPYLIGYLSTDIRREVDIVDGCENAFLADVRAAEISRKFNSPVFVFKVVRRFGDGKELPVV